VHFSLSELTNARVESKDGTRVQLFNRSRPQFRGGPPVLRVRTAGLKTGTQTISPIFSGSVKSRRCRLPTEPNRRRRYYSDVSLHLSLNVARYLSAQNVSLFAERPLLCDVSDVALAGDRSIQEENDERSFGLDANVVMGSPATYRFALSKSPACHLIDLISTIREKITQNLQACIEGRNIRLEVGDEHSLTRVEWHVEFQTLDPRNEVTRLMPLLSRQCVKGNVYKKTLTGQIKIFGPSSQGLQIQLAEGKKVTTYAKTNLRLRMEIKYHRTGLSRVIGPRTRLSANELRRKLDLAGDRAQRDLSELMLGLTPDPPLTHKMPSRDHLVLLINEFSPNLLDSEEIMIQLRDRGRIAVERGSPLRAAVNALREQGVLRFVRYAVYGITDEFRPALNQLMSQDGAVFAIESRIR
jgi:hypothetical protein